MEPPRPDLAARLAAGPPLLLDGATGTELERRGVPSTLPLWSALALLEAPQVVEAIHRDYVAAGAEALTANTFRTQRRTLSRAGIGARAAELTARAVELARRAAGRPGRIAVLGSAPTLEDCYRPERVPEPEALEREHVEHARNLAAAGVDAILIETINTIREAEAALRAARATGLPALLSFVCDAKACLLSGEPLVAALAAVAPLDPIAVGVNCLPPSAVGPCLAPLAAVGLPFGVYANLGAPGPSPDAPRSEESAPHAYAAHAQRWAEAGARYLGGCCGTTPNHIRALAAQRHG